jgi:hypothetical protein
MARRAKQPVESPNSIDYLEKLLTLTPEAQWDLLSRWLLIPDSTLSRFVEKTSEPVLDRYLEFAKEAVEQIKQDGIHIEQHRTLGDHLLNKLKEARKKSGRASETKRSRTWERRTFLFGRFQEQGIDPKTLSLERWRPFVLQLRDQKPELAYTKKDRPISVERIRKDYLSWLKHSAS